MLMDWPEQKHDLQEEWLRATHRQTLGDARVVAQLPHVMLREGHKAAFVYPDGSRREMELSRHKVSLEYDREELARGGGKQLLDAVQKVGGAFAKDMETSLLSVLREASETTGAVFHAKTPRGLAREVVKALEAMHIEFDEDGCPSVVRYWSPETMERLAEIDTPQLRKRIDSILEKKRDEWLHRESRRRLAD